MLEMRGEAAVTQEPSARAWKEGVRGCAGCFWFLLWGQRKSPGPLLFPMHVAAREEAQRVLISPSRGGGLLSGSVFVVGARGTRPG